MLILYLLDRTKLPSMKRIIRISTLFCLFLIVKSAIGQKTCFNLTMPSVYEKDKYANYYPDFDWKSDSLFWTIFDLKNPKEGHYFERWDSLLVKMDGNVVNGKREGIWKMNFRYKNEILTFTVNYKDGKKNGAYNRINLKNNDTTYIQSGNYINDYRNGNVKFEFRGEFLGNCTFKTGELEGDKTTYFYSDNKLKGIDHYRQGKLEGKSIEYNYDGTVSHEKNFQNGIQLGEELVYRQEWVRVSRKKYKPNYYLQDKIIYYPGIGNWTVMRFSQNGDTIDYIRKVDSLKEGRAIEDSYGVYKSINYYHKGSKEGPKIEIYGKDTVSKGYFKNDLEDGLFITFNKKDTLKRSFYINGTREGWCYELNCRKNRKDTIFSKYYHKGMLDGRSVEYGKNNKISSCAYYKKGLLDGKFVGYLNRKYLVFFKKRYIAGESNYKKGLLDGTWKRYHSNGKLKFEIVFKNNIPYTSVAAYSIKGEKLDAGTLKEGNGTFNRYYDLGKPMYSFTFQNGRCKGHYTADFFYFKEEGDFSGRIDTNYNENYNLDQIYSSIRSVYQFRKIRRINDQDTTMRETVFDSTIKSKYISDYKYNRLVGTFSIDSTGNRSGLSKEFYLNGNIKSIEKNIVVYDTLIEKRRKYRYYGIPHLVTALDSVSTRYYESGGIMSRENYVLDKMKGVCKYYDELGMLKREYHIINDSTEFSLFNCDTVNYLNNGVKEGKWISLGVNHGSGCNDNPSEIEFYIHGKPYGIWLQYSDENGNLLNRKVWRDTTIAGEQIYNEQTGRLLGEGSIFRDETKFGKWYIYNLKNGNKVFEFDFSTKNCKYYNSKKGYLKAEGTMNGAYPEGKWRIYNKKGHFKNAKYKQIVKIIFARKNVIYNGILRYSYYDERELRGANYRSEKKEARMYRKYNRKGQHKYKKLIKAYTDDDILNHRDSEII